MRLSASQIQTFTDCQRKWAWRYVAGIEEPPNAAAEKGKVVHAELEKYLRGGDIDYTTETGYIAASGLEHLPKPGTEGLFVEQEFHFEGPSGHTYLGYKDLEVPGIVFDHKTTSDLKWQKTAEDLRTDIQATLYAVDYFRSHPDESDVELRWVYYQTKNARKSAVTVLRVEQPETWNRFLEIEQIAEQISAVADKQPLELPPSVNHCSAYGGCPHQGRCNLSPLEKMRSHMEQNKLLASLQAKKNAAAPGATPLAFAPGGAFAGLPAPAAPPATAPVANRLLARVQANGAPTAAAPAINPPEYQPPLTAPVAAPVAGPAAVAEAPPAAEASRGRGRPRKAAAPVTGMVTKIDTLYINCGPVGVPVVDATTFVVLAKKKLEAGGIADYRFVQFGEGPGMLAVEVATALDALEGTLPAVRLDTTTPEGAIVAVGLVARAGLVVR